MSWEIAKRLAIKAAPVVLGVVLGIGGTKAVEPKTALDTSKLEVIFKPNIIIQKPDPIKAELLCPKK